MKKPKLIFFALAFTATACFGQVPRFQMPSQGIPLPVIKFEIENKIPESHLANLPKQLPIFRYSEKPCEFSKPALRMLLDQSPFAGTNLDNLLPNRNVSNNAVIRLATELDRNHFIVNPAQGKISVQNGNRQFNSKIETPPRDGVPSLEAVSNSVMHYAELFGISTNDMDRNPDGSIHVRRTEDTVTGHRRPKDPSIGISGAFKYQYVDNRSACISRSIGGRILWESEDKVYLQLGINGRLLRFDFNWRLMDSVRTNRLFTAAEILDEIKKGNVLADVTNEYPDDGVAKIILKDIRIDYFTPPSPDFRPISVGADIYPVASIYVTFKSNSGKTTDGGLFAPISESK
jgi:hypothetical protein